MRASLKARIALRYLFAKKSHSAVTAISWVSMIGVAVATAAIVCVLSVFNGFRSVLSGKLDVITADVVVEPARGKTIAGADSLARRLEALPEVAAAMPAVTDNALLIYAEKELPVTLKGVTQKDYDRIVDMKSILETGKGYSLVDSAGSGARFYYDPDFEEWVELDDANSYAALLSVGVASRAGVNASDDRLLLFAPRRTGRLNMANPVNSFLRDSVTVAGVYRSNQSDFDKDLVITDIRVARRLFQYADEATTIEMAAAKGVAPADAAAAVRKALGGEYVVKDRLEQQQTSFRMINIEKWITFLLLAFILLIASFNIISTLSMLVLEKEPAMAAYRSLGATRGDIGGIFAWESFWITLFGAVIGMALGVVLCLLQERYGLIKLNGNPDTLIVDAYPVVLQYADLLVVTVPIAIIGALTALISYNFAKGRTSLRLT